MAISVTSKLSTNTCISQLWALDSLGITDPSEKKTVINLQEVTKQHFLNTDKVKNDHILIYMPWTEGHPARLDNFELYLKRLRKC